ncbi:dTDP-4-dehydrorhamnose reductase [Patescibacteria group bacterium]|nr:dTDP-4-dehydrorhamnose reductase [Patescibacteria group bacterium]MBU1448415.1 dTDP-4-dehydrorhamnose reductase [Patescibacteria group bacterium]MBU2613661.1 dTDP-4-dehydrorhamnose reductase [Patescibacteria group bacterium]
MDVRRPLIIGAKGMLGHAFAERFASASPILLDIEDIDITDAAQVRAKLSDLRPDVVLNAAAYTNVDKAETDRDVAERVNALGPKHLLDACADVGATLIHISTDYVFDGSRAEGYVESDRGTDPVNWYGETKRQGEEALFTSPYPKWYLLRIAWLYGPHGKHFVDTMLRLGAEKGSVTVVDDQTGSPTYTRDVAERAAMLMADDAPFGTYHVVNDGTCTWYGFAKKIFELAGMSVDVTPCTSDTFPRPARRPRYSILRCTKLPPMRRWEEALGEHLTSR